MLMFLEEERYKESIILLKYINERYPERRLDLKLYFYLIFTATYESSHATEYYYSKIKRLIEVNEKLINVNETSPDKNPFYPELDTETPITRITAKKIKEKPIEADEVIEEQKPTIESIIDSYIFRKSEKLIEEGFVKTAKMMLSLTHDKEQTRYKYLLLSIFMATKNTDEAMIVLNDLLIVDNENVDYCVNAYRLLNWCELQEEPPITELEQFLSSKFMTMNDNQRFVFLHLFCKKMMERSEFGKAAEVLNAAVKFFSKSPHFNYLMGYCLYNERNYAKSLDYLSVANFYDNEHSDTIVHILLCLDKLGLDFKFNMMLEVMRKINVEHSSSMEELREVLKRKGLDNDNRGHNRNTSISKMDLRTSIMESFRKL